MRLTLGCIELYLSKEDTKRITWFNEVEFSKRNIINFLCILKCISISHNSSSRLSKEHSSINMKLISFQSLCSCLWFLMLINLKNVALPHSLEWEPQWTQGVINCFERGLINDYSHDGLDWRAAHHLFTQQEIFSINLCRCLPFQKNSQPLLPVDRYIWGILNCYGWVPISPMTTLLTIAFLTVLHPRHKLAYFKTVWWEEEWIKTAASLVHEQFERSYLEVDINDGDADVVDATAVSTVDDSDLPAVCLFFVFKLMLFTSYILEYLWQYASTGSTQINWLREWTWALLEHWYWGCPWCHPLVARVPSSISSPILNGPGLLDNTQYFSSHSPSIQLMHVVEHLHQENVILP